MREAISTTRETCRWSLGRAETSGGVLMRSFASRHGLRRRPRVEVMAQRRTLHQRVEEFKKQDTSKC